MEQAQGLGQSQEGSAPVLTTSAREAQPAPVAASDERIFRQNDVNEIVKREKYAAVESYKRQMAEQPLYAAQKYGDVGTQNHSQANEQRNLSSENDIRRLAAEEAQRLRDVWVNEAKTKAEADNAQRIVQQFWNKIQTGKEKFDDFDKVTGDIEYARFPNTVQLLSEYVDNSADVLYELGKDRIKMAQLEQLAYMSPRDAVVHAQRLSQSLKDNESASKIRNPNEPLSQMRPSNTGTDSGVMSVKDLRAKYRI